MISRVSKASPCSTATNTTSSSSAATNTKFFFVSTSSLRTFITPIILKLDDDNFLILKQQDLATLWSLNLENFLDNSVVPIQFLNEEVTFSHRTNQNFLKYCQQDQLIVA